VVTASVVERQTGPTKQYSAEPEPRGDTRSFWLTMFSLSIAGSVCLVVSAVAIAFAIAMAQVVIRDTLWTLPAPDPLSRSYDLTVESLTVKDPRSGRATQAGCWGESGLTFNVTVRNLGPIVPDARDTRVEFVGTTLDRASKRTTLHAQIPVEDLLPNREQSAVATVPLTIPAELHGRQMLWTASIADRNGRVSKFLVSGATGNTWASATVGPCESINN
jgi:hypothetical protein